MTDDLIPTTKTSRCADCRYWHKGYLLHSYRMPASCNKSPFRYAKYDDPACDDFSGKDDTQ